MNRISFSLVLFICSFFMLHSGAEKIKSHYKLYINGVFIQGEVVFVLTKHRTKKHDLNFLTVSYYVNSEKLVLKGRDSFTWPWVPTRGDVVTVVYDADNHENSAIFSTWGFYVLPVLQILFGFFCFCWGVFLLIRKR